MYYKLKEEFRLRGWEMLPTGLVKRLSGKVGFLDPVAYRALQKACGMISEDSPLLSPQERWILAELKAEGILEESAVPVPLTPEQRYRRYPNRYLNSVHWAVTGKCNSRCRHCYMSAPSGVAGEYSHEMCMEIVRQMEAAGVRTVSLTGGEALLRRDFFEIVDALTDADILVTTVMSNGFLVNEKTLGEFERRGLKPEFNISFDGTGCHDWLRGVEGAEKSAVRAFALCREHGFPTGAEYCLHRGNIAALRESVNLLASLGVASLKVNRLSLEGEGRGIADHAISCEEEFQTYLDYIPEFYEDGAPLSLMLSGFFKNIGKDCYGSAFVKRREEDDCGDYCICGHARSNMYLTPDGFIVPCIPMGSAEGGRRHFPNIRETTIAEALSGSVYMTFVDTRLRDYFAHNPGCASCGYKNRCAAGCRGHVAEAGGGDDLLARDEDACTFFRQGWYDKLTRKMTELGIVAKGTENSGGDTCI